jgi:glycylpeptide N-tetradecanoyltransferase|eukprot:COSAG01_NODE_11553_length_1904_cov_9.474792_2_plen_373_part_00
MSEPEPEQMAHKFWDTQPVPRLDEGPIDESNEAVEPDKPQDEIRQDPYPLLKQFEWSEFDVDDEAQMQDVYTLLNENYVEDDDNMFRFDYSPAFLRWALKPPGWKKLWHLCVRVASNKKMVACITAVPVLLNIKGTQKKMVEINFLCVHKKLRSKRLAPVLIKEITRRVHVTDMFQAVYTAGVVLPKPVAQCRYWHRSLRPKKLIEVGFSRLQERMTMSRLIKLLKLPPNPLTPGVRPMVDADVAPVTKLLNEYLGNGEAKFYPIFDEEEVRHWFAPRDEVVCTYVVETEGTVTDFLSFYTLPSTVIGNPKHNSLKAAYSFYNVANTVTIEALMSAQHAGIFTTLSACLLLCPPPNLPIDRRRAPLSIPAAR